MKLSELIQRLAEKITEEGDIELPEDFQVVEDRGRLYIY